ncbi:MAG: sulfatase [Planctomycetes bacterium]|nr:sulfatase [Planctomycetota bacterium]
MPTSPRSVSRLHPLALLAAVSVALAAGAAAQEAPRRPNVLFVFSDDHAVSAIGAYRGRFASLDPTPRIDALARQGVLFRNSFCTNSLCGPSRAVVLTGLHSHRNGFRKNGETFDGSQTTFPKLLHAAGYETALIGKWHLTSEPQGFDHWEVLPGQGDYYDPDLVSTVGTRRIEGYCTDVVTDLAIDWLEHREHPERPFLLMCQHKAPHRNWMPAPRHLGLYRDVEIPYPDSLFDDHLDDASPTRAAHLSIDTDMSLVHDLFVTPWPGLVDVGQRAQDRSGTRNVARMSAAVRAVWDAAFAAGNLALREDRLVGRELVRWKYQRFLQDYLATVRGVDDSVGRLVDWLDEHGLGDDTIVVYSSDQGFFLGEHGFYDKRWMYEESLRMPLIVRWSGHFPAGAARDELVQNLDYAPTLLDLAGVPVPAAMQGRSLAPLLRGDGPPGGWRDAIYYHYHGYPDIHDVARHYGIRTARWKLIRYYQSDEWELFDLQDDPQELRNRYGEPELGGVVATLRARLEQLRVEYGDDTDVSEQRPAGRQGG